MDLDFDATDDRVHRHSEGRVFHGSYGAYCFLPLYVFCGEQLLVSYLRPSRRGAARHASAILELLATRLRAVWPEVRIIVWADSGFCRWKRLEAIRPLALARTELARAQVIAIRLKLLKIGTVILRHTRRIRLLVRAPFRCGSLLASLHGLKPDVRAREALPSAPKG